LVHELGARRILEAGCGTGHWLAAMHAPGRDLYGLDPSIGMLIQARRRHVPLHLVQGHARRLPFPSESFDLVYCVNALHHFHDPPAFVGQAYRLLRPGGALAIAGTDPHGHRESWYVYHYFEGTYETDLNRFPTWETVWDWLVAAGFARLSLAEVEHISAPKQGRQVLADPFLQKNACSQLALLSDEAYRAGLHRIEAALAQAEAGGEILVFQTDIVIEMLTGLKPTRLAGGL
jgi:ubiquinone/menaquinone biosynthesis C-methylase UbiE